MSDGETNRTPIPHDWTSVKLRAQSGAIMVVGAVLALIGAALFIHGLVPDLDFSSNQIDMEEVGSGIVVLIVGLFLVVLGSGTG